MRRFSRSISSLSVILVLVVFAVDAVLAFVNLRTIARINAQVDHTLEVANALERAFSTLKDAETGQRGYLLTRKDEYLTPFEDAERNLGPALGRLRTLTSDNPDLHARTVELAGLASVKMGEMVECVRLGREGRFDAALALVLTDRGRDVMRRAREVVANIRREEDRLLAERSATSRSAVRRTLATFALTTGLGLTLLAGISVFHRRDRRERERSSELIRRSERWLATTLSSIGDAVIATDERGRVRLINPVAEALTGWSQERAEGRPIEEVFHILNESTRAPAEHPVTRVLREGVVVGLANHTVVVSRDGVATPIEDSAAPIRDDGGVVTGVVMVFRDVAEQRRSEEALHASLERFRQLADAMPQIVWTARPDGFVDYFNERWYEFTGLDHGHGGDPSWESIIHPDELASYRDRWYHSVRTGDPYQIEHRSFDQKTGQYRWHLGRALAVRDEAGRVVKWYGTATDIDDQKRAEEASRLARDEAERANQAKDQFLAILSHELRTPLNPILLVATSMLQRPPGPDEMRTNLEMIRHNVELQSRLIDDLLDVMRIAQNKLRIRSELVDCHALIERASGVFRGEIEAKGLRLTLDLRADRHHLDADPDRLQQVLWNLIKNAAKFTPGGGEITIRTRDEGPRLIVEFSDTGIGIDPKALSRIFDPFHQGETSITRRYGGLGLGLSISRGVIEGHGGSIAADSPGPGKGATLRIDLPTVAAPRPIPGSDAPPIPGAQATDAASSFHLLLVEDDQTTREALARLLRMHGHRVEAVGSVASALELVETSSFDLIVSDIGLTDGSGLELMSQVIARRGPIPAIALTGFGMEEDVRRSLAAGFSAHMTKPIDFAKLQVMIRRVATEPGSPEARSQTRERS